MLHKMGFWELIYSLPLLFSCQDDPLVAIYSGLKTRGLRHGSGSKRVILGTGQTKKGDT